MSSERSPYKEVNIRPIDALQMRKLRRDPSPSVCVDRAKLPKDGHDFAPRNVSTMARGKEAAYSNTKPCRRCGKPKFAVEGTRCRGKRK